MKVIKKLIVAMALLSAVAIAREGILFPKAGFTQPQMSSNESSVVFFRQSGDSSSIPSLWIDGNIVGSLTSNSYAQTIACAGNRHIRVDDRYSVIDRGSEEVFSISNNNTLYIEVVNAASNGHFSLRVIDANQAISLLSQKNSKSHIINRYSGKCDSVFLEALTDPLFDFDKSTLNKQGISIIDGIANNMLRNISSLQGLKIEGFTDRLGKSARNNPLSLARAKTIASHLQKRGIKVPMETIGMGSRYPVSRGCVGNKATTALKACLAPDRRVRIEMKGLTPSNSKIEYSK
jgi:OOP family OmpA-OmpF porin